MRGFELAFAAALTALVLGCGSKPNGNLRFELAFDGDPAVAAERVRERLALVDERDDVSLREVTVHENSKSGLDVDIAVAAGEACEGLETARLAVRAALERAQYLSMREVLDIDDAFVGALKAALGEEADVRPVSGQPYLEIVPRGTAEGLAELLRGVTTDTAETGLEVAEEYDHGAVVGLRYRVWPLAKRSELHEGNIDEAKVIYDQFNLPAVQASLTSGGAQRFEALTARITGRFLAILVDDEVKSAPKVMEPIRGGRLQVTLGSPGRGPQETLAEARLLALSLRSGPIAKNVAIKAETAACQPGE